MARVLVLAAALTMMVVGPGCGSDDPDTAAPSPGALTVDQARARVAKVVDDTVARVAHGLTTQPDPPPPPGLGLVQCDSPGGEPVDEYIADYGVEIELGADADPGGLVDRTRRFWSERGYEVATENLETDVPVVYGSFEGYRLLLRVVTSTGRAQLGGSTPCLPRTTP